MGPVTFHGDLATQFVASPAMDVAAA